MAVKSNKKTENQSAAKKQRAKYGGGSIRFNKSKNAYVVSYKGKSTTVKTQTLAEQKLREFKKLMKNVSENDRKKAKERKDKANRCILRRPESSSFVGRADP